MGRSEEELPKCLFLMMRIFFFLAQWEHFYVWEFCVLLSGRRMGSQSTLFAFAIYEVPPAQKNLYEK
jgi:hypothetical protein